MRVPCLVPLLAWAGSVSAAVVTYNWTIDWVTAAPDGYSRPVIGVDKQWPCPKMEAYVGDTVIVEIYNNLGNESTGLHFHGIRQFGSPEMDGPVGATQCTVPPGSSFTYQFKVDIPGTFWWHSHVMGQYPDGLRGALIVHDPEDPYMADEEVVMTVSDWYHNQSIPLVQAMLEPTNTHFAPPFPDSILVNEGGSSIIEFDKGKTYRLRIISFAALAGVMIAFEDHTMQIVMQDGSYITPTNATLIRLSAAQRYDVLLTPNSNDQGNYPYLVALDTNADWLNANATDLPISYDFNITGYLQMDASAPMTAVYELSNFEDVADDSTFTDLELANALTPTDTIQMDFAFCDDVNGIPRACFNGKPYVDQKVPTLYSVATTGTSNTDPTIYGQVNPYIVESGAVVELVVNNQDVASHPFHLHGHQFQVIERPASNAGEWPGTTVVPAHPASKDTINVNGNSYAVIRFTADNPGVWLFHCHIEWHVEMGLTATIIEAPEVLRSLQIPQDHLDVCKLSGTPYSGNAAGNTVDYTDTSGMNTVNPSVYTGALWEPTTSAATSAAATSAAATSAATSAQTSTSLSTQAPTSSSIKASSSTTLSTKTTSTKTTSTKASSTQTSTSSSARHTSTSSPTPTPTPGSSSGSGGYGTGSGGSGSSSGDGGSWSWTWWLKRARV